MKRVITSKDNQIIKLAYSLKQKKYRQQYHLFLAEGNKILKIALKENKVKDIFTCIDLDFEVPDDVNFYKVNDDVIKKLSSTESPEGIVFTCSYNDSDINYDGFNKIVYLDKVNDPGNLGTIIRSAVAFNYDAVICSKGSVDFYNEKVVAASKGGVFLIPLIQDDLSKFKNSHTIIVSALKDDAIELNNLKKPDKFVLVLGNEAHGVSQDTLLLADIVTKIEINDIIDSLNVSIAGGILMNHLK